MYVVIIDCSGELIFLSCQSTFVYAKCIVVMNCHIICVLHHLQIELNNIFLLFIVFVKKCGGMTIAIKVEF